MGKNTKEKKESSSLKKKIHDVLAEKHACYVLITCDAPSENGDMNVEMTYEGDPMLAAYLLQGAQTYVDEYQEEELFLDHESRYIE